MDASRIGKRVRIRVYAFLPTDVPGEFADKLTHDIECDFSDLAVCVAAAYEGIPTDYVAFVCDAVPDAAIKVGHARQSSALGQAESQAGAALDSPA